MDLEGQVAIVTGAGRGIGQAIARRFAEEGAGIAVIDIDRDAANETAEVIRARGGRAVAETADVSSPEQVKAAVADVVRELGRIDILVNNAGVEKRAPFFEITPDDWRQQLEVNLSGTFYCTQAAGREMAARRYGRVVNVSSVAGLIGPIDLAAYGAAKAGIIGLTRAAALDLADHSITVNAIAPGPIETELMLGVWTAEALRERPQHGAIARFGTVDEIAHTGDVRPFPVADSVPGRTGGWDGSPPSSVLPVAVDHATKVWEQRGNLARLAVQRPVMAPGGNGKRNGGGRSRRIWSLTG